MMNAITGKLGLLSLFSVTSVTNAAVVTLNNLDFRPNGTLIGTPSGGGALVAITNLTSTTAANVMDFDFEITGLDLDSVGGANDKITFTVRVTNAAAGQNVNFNNQGMGALPGNPLIQGESLNFTLVNLGISSGTLGSITSSGYTGGSLNASSGSGGGNPTIAGGTITGAITPSGGSAIPISHDFNANNADGYKYTNGAEDFTLASSIDFSVSARTADPINDGIDGDGRTPNGWVRGLDLEFTHTVPEPSSALFLALGLFASCVRRRS